MQFFPQLFHSNLYAIFSYKQKKFNLFREECEGYAKLITELNQCNDTRNLSYTMDVIKSLIGCFNLDPNRVLDVILDSFESHYQMSDFYLPLLKEYMPQSKTLSDVLGFKYVFYYDSCTMTPKSLYIITAFLLQHNAILLEDMYGWVSIEIISSRKIIIVLSILLISLSL